MQNSVRRLIETGEMPIGQISAGHRLAEAVRRWGEWGRERAIEELHPFYPLEPDGTKPLQMDLFGKTPLPADREVEFYKQEVDLANRLLLGNSR